MHLPNTNRLISIVSIFEIMKPNFFFAFSLFTMAPLKQGSG